VPNDRERDLQVGLGDVAARAAHFGVKILDRSRPWPNRRATYFVIGQAESNSDIVLTDEFVRDLPGTTDYQKALDEYLGLMVKRVSCGSPRTFYCKSEVPILISVHWPLDSGVGPDHEFRAWIRIEATDLRNESTVTCVVYLDAMRMQSNKNPFDQLRDVINRVRRAIDQKNVVFHAAHMHPEFMESIPVEIQRGVPQTSPDIERFVLGKVYWLGFRAASVPGGRVWILDPWDAHYLGTSVRELGQAVQISRARGLVELDHGEFARPSDKLIAEGLGDTSSESDIGVERYILSDLPRKAALLDQITSSLKQPGDIAVLVIDLDHFKQVNDTMGHLEGDACLQRVVEVIGGIVASKGKLYRWGGDEFAVCLQNFITAEAHATAERIRLAIESAKPGRTISVTASIGICARDHAGQPSAEGFLDCADKAMYESKRGGKNRVTRWPFGEAGGPI
jgi:diguanylate cyclase (GGDEF)-like protein